ncbi:MAG: hypothetical protein WA003_16930 [Desulfuromonadaceae bacterium]
MKIKKIEDLLALRGKIAIEYDWEREEESELKAAEDDLAIFQSVEKWP